MATSLLRLGRLSSLKCLRLESVLRTRSAAAFCTQTEEPTKKTAGASKKAAAAAAPPEPEEPFDNSTYKNNEHHGYNPYTFADLDLEMAKHRLPQPSSGRPSPQH
ncbi:NADH dehydrogenase [ubiquinone] flavoprotein 3, mitochondrial [Scomber scombrus]|uniref:NADH dehydrogenase [ubiquinone] flavoprotein 3, mitochondrial n=1 Tax=Scomber scombrus TaxID=13677 RepID=UPI002DDAAFB8|nr:NADH dehydrogenase [ubiquinone] flavoprotein 3, mitochondrial [Scomber scombrus]